MSHSNKLNHLPSSGNVFSQLVQSVGVFAKRVLMEVECCLIRRTKIKCGFIVFLFSKVD